MKFRFPLQTVLRIRRHEESAQKKLFADAQRVVQAINEEITRKETDLLEFTTAKSPDVFKASDLERRYAYMHDIHRQQFELGNELKKAEAEAAKERKKLVEAHRKTKILENLENKKRLEFIAEQNRQEMIALNETATIRFNRSRSAL